MNMLRVNGQVDENHRLIADVPASVAAGPVTVWIMPTSQTDDAAEQGMAGIADQWVDEMADDRQDIYTLADGEPIGEP